MYKIEICNFDNPTHTQAYTRLLEEYMLDPMGDYRTHTPAEQQELLERLAQHPGAFVVLLSDGDEYVAMSTCFELLSTFKVKPYIYIHDFMVSKNRRNKHTGRAMMEQIVKLANEKGCCKVTLEVRVDNPAAMKLYKNTGFEPCQPDMLFWTKTL